GGSVAGGRSSPRWLRLTRVGDVVTALESGDGGRWVEVGSSHLRRQEAPLLVGLFVTSPCDLTRSEGACRFTQATATFDSVSIEGTASRRWQSAEIGKGKSLTDWEKYHQASNATIE